MADTPAPSSPSSATLVRVGGAAGVAGGLAWVVKGVTILATGVQPPLALELALPLLGASLVGVAHLVLPAGHRRSVVATFAWFAVASGTVALSGEILDRSWDPSIAAWALTLIAGQLSLAGVRAAPAPVVFWTGVGAVPALLVGGALAAIDERLLELPLVCLGLAWMSIGLLTLAESGAARAGLR